jgi:dGTPase
VSRFLTVRRRDREAAEAALAPAATRSAGAVRERPEDPDPYRTAFERDRDRILHSKAFRRLKHKTQVFMNPDGDHYVTRLTHTLQVTQVGRAMAAALGLNQALTEAICLGHDVGHSPFGHTGEEALSPYVAGEWHHAAQSVRVIRILEPLNPTLAVIDGIRAHSWKVDPPPETPEAFLCRFADRIAYLSHDVLDALRAGVLTEDEVPGRDLLGEPGSPWIARLIEAVVEGSHQAGVVAMTDDVAAVMQEVRDFMFARVYLRPEAEAQRREAIRVIRGLVDYYLDNPSEIPDSYRHPEADAVTQVLDYVSGMTDRFALSDYRRITASSA